jgi:hypothetical protein
MAYARIENNEIVEYPLYSTDIQLRFPETSFSVPFSPPEGFIEVLDSAPPEINIYKQRVEEDWPEFKNNFYHRTWKVIELSEKEINFKTQSLITEIKGKRTRLLMNSDWTQLPDAPVDQAAWAEYRQKLRNLTLQEGFPFDFEWPETP